MDELIVVCRWMELADSRSHLVVIGRVFVDWIRNMSSSRCETFMRCWANSSNIVFFQTVFMRRWVPFAIGKRERGLDDRPVFKFLIEEVILHVQYSILAVKSYE